MLGDEGTTRDRKWRCGEEGENAGKHGAFRHDREDDHARTVFVCMRAQRLD